MAVIERSEPAAGIVQLTLNRPAALNAMTAERVQSLHEHLAAIAVEHRATVVSYDTDFVSLERELRGSSYDEPDHTDEADDEDEDDPYTELASRYADLDDGDIRRIG